MLSFDEQAREILEAFYKPEAIYLQHLSDYVPDSKYAVGRFSVPLLPSYSVQPINYVTAEQYMRCLSQLSYVLIGMLIQDSVLKFNGAERVSYAVFMQLLVDCKLYFLRTDVSYRQKTLRDEPFELKLTVTNARTIKQFHICGLQISGALRGELELCGE